MRAMPCQISECTPEGLKLKTLKTSNPIGKEGASAKLREEQQEAKKFDQEAAQ
jgi:hypothetical protein